MSDKKVGDSIVYAILLLKSAGFENDWNGKNIVEAIKILEKVRDALE